MTQKIGGMRERNFLWFLEVYMPFQAQSLSSTEALTTTREIKKVKSRIPKLSNFSAPQKDMDCGLTLVKLLCEKLNTLVSLFNSNNSTVL